MKRLALLCVLLAGQAVAEDDNLIFEQNGEVVNLPLIVGPPFCVNEKVQGTCFKLIVSGGTADSNFEVLTIGPGGRICGPAVVRVFKDGEPALTLDAGVCIPAEDKR